MKPFVNVCKIKAILVFSVSWKAWLIYLRISTQGLYRGLCKNRMESLSKWKPVNTNISALSSTMLTYQLTTVFTFWTTEWKCFLTAEQLAPLCAPQPNLTHPVCEWASECLSPWEGCWCQAAYCRSMVHFAWRCRLVPSYGSASRPLLQVSQAVLNPSPQHTPFEEQAEIGATQLPVCLPSHQNGALCQ